MIHAPLNFQKAIVEKGLGKTSMIMKRFRD